jgi:hypothetical protein
MFKRVSRLKNARSTTNPGIPGNSTDTAFEGTSSDLREILDMLYLFWLKGESGDQPRLCKNTTA